MRRILKRHEVVADEWLHFGEAAADGTNPVAGAGENPAVAPHVADAAAVIVPVAELRKDPGSWLARGGKLGVRIGPAESVESLADLLPRVALVAVEFPGVGEGRGFSYGRLLRDRLHFKGELRAVGAAVKQDKIFLLARCGFRLVRVAAGRECRRGVKGPAALRRGVSARRAHRRDQETAVFCVTVRRWRGGLPAANSVPRTTVPVA